jgi:hypothetical protein
MARLDRWRWHLLGAGVGVTAVVLWSLFYELGHREMARPAVAMMAVIVSVVKVEWELHTQLWFWLIIALVAALHAYVLVWVPWTARWVPAVVMLPFAVIDGAAIIIAVDFVGRRCNKKTADDR